MKLASYVPPQLVVATTVTAWVGMFAGGLYLGNYVNGWWLLMTVFALAIVPWNEKL